MLDVDLQLLPQIRQVIGQEDIAGLGELVDDLLALWRRYVDPELKDALLQYLAREAESGTKMLSRREQEVLRMLAHGYTLKEIADSLEVSRKTIETYRARMQEKLGLRTRSDIVQYALQMGLFNADIGRAS